MKTNFAKLCGQNFRTALAASALLLSGGLAARAQVQPASPVGTWDFVISGSHDGLAYITFVDGGTPASRTFNGFEIIVPRPDKAFQVNAGRGGDASRNGTIPPTPATPIPGTNLFGGIGITGNWGFDELGRVLGYYPEVGPIVCLTNPVPTSTNTSVSLVPVSGTNASGSDTFCVSTTVATNATDYLIQTTCYTNRYSCLGITNAVSFIGRPVPGKRFAMVASTPFGRITYRGVWAVALTNLNGSQWYGVKRDLNRQSFTEFFSLTSGALINTYGVNGAGPGYVYSSDLSVAMFSSQGKMAFDLSTAPSNAVVRATFGSFNPRTIRALTAGWEQPDGPLTGRIGFNAVKTGP